MPKPDEGLRKVNRGDLLAADPEVGSTRTAKPDMSEAFAHELEPCVDAVCRRLGHDL